MTLIHFCLSLDDPSEIRSYLSAYLGAKPEVSHFATEFLKRKQDLRHGARGPPSPAAGFATAAAQGNGSKASNAGGKQAAPQPAPAAGGRKSKKK
jgi:hypothetical protein